MLLVDEAGDVLHAEALVTGAADAEQLAAAGVVVERPPAREQAAKGDAGTILRLARLRGWLAAALARVVVAAGGAEVTGVVEGLARGGPGMDRIIALAQALGLARLALADAGIPHVVVPCDAICLHLHGVRRLPKPTKPGAKPRKRKPGAPVVVVLEAKEATRLAVLARWGYEWVGDGEGDLADAYVLTRVPVASGGESG
jgi:hypothetical protein